MLMLKSGGLYFQMLRKDIERRRPSLENLLSETQDLLVKNKSDKRSSRGSDHLSTLERRLSDLTEHLDQLDPQEQQHQQLRIHASDLKARFEGVRTDSPVVFFCRRSTHRYLFNSQLQENDNPKKFFGNSKTGKERILFFGKKFISSEM